METVPSRQSRLTDRCNLRRRQVDWKGLHKVRGALRVLSVMGRKPEKKAGDLEKLWRWGRHRRRMSAERAWWGRQHMECRGRKKQA